VPQVLQLMSREIIVYALLCCSPNEKISRDFKESAALPGYVPIFTTN
jgi:hypothetical protein